MERNRKNQFLLLQILVAITAISEVVGVMSIGPFIAIAADPELIKNSTFIEKIFINASTITESKLLTILGLIVFLALTISSALSMLTIWLFSIFGAKFGSEIASKLYEYYMQKDWLFHTKNNSSLLTKKVATECQRVSGGIIIPFMNFNAKIISCLFIITSIFIYSPKTSLIGVSFFITLYYLIYRAVQKKIQEIGDDLTSSQTQRFKLMNNGFGGIKEILLLNKQEKFNEEFYSASEKFTTSTAKIQIISLIPRHAIEFIAFGTIIAIITYLTNSQPEALSSIIPKISIYAIAGLKLLPAFQQIYTNLSTIRSNISALDSIKDDLNNAIILGEYNNQSNKSIPFNNRVELQDIHFSYPRISKSILSGIYIGLPKNNFIGIVGGSGSGKSTLIDILAGLIPIGKGQILVDDKKIETYNNKSWQKLIGLVPQNIYLIDGSIRENIALGVPPAETDEEQIDKAVNMANLKSFISELPSGLNTEVGERGVQLSGGQRQRIGIARALYNNPQLLVFDEATSALDVITESEIMASIEKLSNSKTIIFVTHRLETIRNCDKIYVIDKGKVVDSGSYKHLQEFSDHFKRILKNQR